MSSEEYYIRVKSNKIVFPSICPVCGDPVEEEGTIPAISARDRKVGREVTRHTTFAAGGYYAIVRSTPDFKIATPVEVPACGRHAIRYEDTGRYRAPCGIISGLLVFLLIFLVFSILGSFVLGLEPPLTNFLYLVIVIVGLYVSNGLSGRTALEKALTILDGSPEIGMMIIRIKSGGYAENLLQLNQMTAERVMPIHRKLQD